MALWVGGWDGDSDAMLKCKKCGHKQLMPIVDENWKIGEDVTYGAKQTVRCDKCGSRHFKFMGYLDDKLASETWQPPLYPGWKQWQMKTMRENKMFDELKQFKLDMREWSD
ncbi:MAG: hypothetical protein MPK62_02050 [Alphaproteobacteria bacterium]|nr:hypothetical protein [Alphaproteobacteria bacterium]MDA8029916.1 hypothetical protein [Alphaproteobacteria bacterium]